MRVKKYPGEAGNAYSASKYLYNSINVTKNNTIASSGIANEGIDFTPDEEHRGGVIVLSTDVNAKVLDSNKFINWIKQKAHTLNNRINGVKKIDTTSVKHNLLGWTVGKFLSGRYHSNKTGKTYGENSLSVELIGVTSNELISIAEELCKKFEQESVLVKDYNNGSVYFISD